MISLNEKGVRFLDELRGMPLDAPLSSEHGTHKTVEYGTHKTLEYGTHKTIEYGTHKTVEYGTHKTVEYGTHKTVEARCRTWRSGKSD